MQTKPTLVPISGTGTPFGWSYWASWLGCLKAAWLRSRRERRDGLSGNYAADVGTVCHLYTKLWMQRGDTLNTARLNFVDPAESHPSYYGRVIQEADRVFRQYRTLRTVREWGAVLCLEEPRELGVHPLGFMVPFTWQPDMVVKLSKGEAKAMELPLAGKFLVDHKFFDKRSEWIDTWAQYDLRFPMYYLAEREHTEGLRGTILNVVYRTKEVTVERFFVPPPTGEKLERALAMAELAQERKDQMSSSDVAPLGNAEHCLTRFGACGFLEKGCSGY